VLTKRGADVLVRVEKLLDEAAKTATKTTSSDDAAKHAGPAPSSSALAFPQNYAAEENARGPASRKN
jgi:penicillin-binding protein 1A